MGQFASSCVLKDFTDDPLAISSSCVVVMAGVGAIVVGWA